MASERPHRIKELKTARTKPQEIDKADLKKGGGFLIPQTEVDKIRQLIADGKLNIGTGIRLTKKQLKKFEIPIDSDYSVAIVPKADGYQITAIYYGIKIKEAAHEDKTLGRGSFGKVKLGQDLTSGEFVATKVQASPLPSQKKKQAAEAHILQQVDPAAGYFDYQPTGKNKGRYTKPVVTGMDAEGRPITKKESSASITIMTLAPGKPLSKQLDSLSTLERYQIALQMIQLIQELHGKGILHLDIKLENFMYDKATRRLTLIDFGESLELNPATATAEETFRGSPFTMPPELKIFFDMRDKLSDVKSEALVRIGGEGGLKNTILRYSKETDNYSLGIALGQLFGLTHMPEYDGKGPLPPPTITQKDSQLFRDNDVISDPAARSEMVDFLQRLTATSIAERPTTEKAQDFFSHAALQHGVSKVGIINVAEYLAMDMRGTFHLEQALRAFDELILIIPQSDLNDEIKDNIKGIEDLLAGENVTIRHRYYGSENLDQLMADVKRADEGAPPSKYYYLTEKELSETQKSSLPRGIQPIEVKVDQPYQSDAATPEQKEAIRQHGEAIRQQVMTQMAPRRSSTYASLASVLGKPTGPQPAIEAEPAAKETPAASVPEKVSEKMLDKEQEIKPDQFKPK